MTPGEFLRDRTGRLLLSCSCMAALTVFLYFTGASPDILVLILIPWLTVQAAVLLAGYVKENARIKELEFILDGLDKKYLLMECVTKPSGIYERKIFELMRRAGKSMIEAVSDSDAGRRAYREYVEGWVHEIKAPITAARLVCENNRTEPGRKLPALLAQIEDHVERALYYARAGSVEKDFIVRETRLEETVREAVAKHRTLLIQSGVSVDADKVSGSVYTDGKWVSFMLGQFLSNAVRYRKESATVTFVSEREGDFIRLSVTDNGIGIPANELPRIFERGFTGSNGRGGQSRATGMGLFICKGLADFLQIKLEVKSEQGRYTEIVMRFPAKANLSKM